MFWHQAWIQACPIWAGRRNLQNQLSIFRKDRWSIIHVVGTRVSHVLVRNPEAHPVTSNICILQSFLWIFRVVFVCKKHDPSRSATSNSFLASPECTVCGFDKCWRQEDHSHSLCHSKMFSVTLLTTAWRSHGPQWLRNYQLWILHGTNYASTEECGLQLLQKQMSRCVDPHMESARTNYVEMNYATMQTLIFMIWISIKAVLDTKLI